MKSLKLSKTEKKRYMRAPVASGDSDGPDYPWGFELEIEKDQIKKLGIEGLEAGEMVMIQAVGKVTRVSVTDRDKGDDTKSMSIQIQKMEINNRDDAEAAFNE